ARLRGQPLLQHPDPTIQRLLLDAHAEVVEAKALKNLRLHERRLRRQYEKDKAELNELRNERLEQEKRERQAELRRQQEEAQREQEAREQERRREQAQKRAERRKAREEAAQHGNGFEFSTVLETGTPIPTLPNQEP
ncbi:MAG: hypothetical protein ACJ73N_12225, partial [Bryobacteraceae bacterium]